MSRILAIALVVLAVAGCVAPPVIDGPLFRAHEPPDAGYARVYLFRPGFSRVSSGDAPALLINDIEVGNLLYESYLPFAFGPGTHRISLKPTFLDSSVWKADYEFSVESGRTYFLAVWNTVDATSGTRMWIPVPIPGAIVFLQPGQVGDNTGVRLEFVAEQEALPVIRELRLVRPKREVF